MVTQQRVELRVSGQYGKTAEGRVSTCNTAEGRDKGFRTMWLYSRR